MVSVKNPNQLGVTVYRQDQSNNKTDKYKLQQMGYVRMNWPWVYFPVNKG